MKKSLVVAFAVAAVVSARGIAHADVIPPQETACQGLSLGAVCNVGTCEQRTCARLTYTTNDAGGMVPGSYQYPCLYCMDVGRAPDAGASADAGVSADAGPSSDAAASTSSDAAASADASANSQPVASSDPGEDSSCAVGRFSTAARSIGPWLLALVGWVPIAISRARRRRRGE